MADETIGVVFDVDLSGLKSQFADAEAVASNATKKMAKNTSDNFKKSDKEVKKLDQSFKGLKSSATTAAKSITLVATAGFAAAAGMVKLIDEVTTYRDVINTAGAATGLTNETIAGLDQLAKSTGKSLESILPKRLAANMLVAAEGSKEMAAGFELLEVEVGKVGNLRNVNDTFLELIDNLSEMERGADRSAIAARVLGKAAGTELLSAIDAGSDGLKAFIEQGEKWGIDVGPDAVKQTNEWQSAMQTLDLAVDDAKQSILDGFGGTGEAANAFKAGAAVIVASGDFIGKLLEDTADKVEATLVLFKSFETLDFGAAAGAIETLTKPFDAVGAAIESAGLGVEFYNDALETSARVTKDVDDDTRNLVSTLEDEDAILDKIRFKQETTNREFVDSIRIMADLETEFDDLIDVLEDMADDLDDMPDRWDLFAAAARGAGDEVRDVSLEVANMFAAFEDLAAFNIQMLGDEVDARRDATDARFDDLRQEIEHQELLGNISAAQADAELDQLDIRQHAREEADDQFAASQSKIAKDSFKGQKELGIASAIINGAVAIVAAFAQLGPIGGAIAAVGIGVTTGVQIAKISAQQPPEFAIGRGPVAVGTATPDHQLAGVRPDERILSGGATARLGSDGAAALERGSGFGMPDITLALDSGIIGRIVGDRRTAGSIVSNVSASLGVSFGRAPVYGR